MSEELTNASPEPVVENVVTTPEVTPEVTQETTPTENSGSDVKLNGDGDWFNTKNYSDKPEEFIKQRDMVVKELARTHNLKMQELKGSKSKYAFNQANELVELIKKDPTLQDEIRRIQEEESPLTEATKTPEENYNIIRNNWNRLTPQQQSEVFKTLPPVYQESLKNSLELEQIKQEKFNTNLEIMEQSNIKKYGDVYKEKSNNLINYFQENFTKNAREFAFRAMNYDEYGKQMAEKGRQEALKNLSGASGMREGTGNISSNNNETPMQALESAMAKYGITDIAELLAK